MKYMIRIMILLLAAVWAVGCSTTRRLQEDDILYTGVRRMSIESVDGDKLPGEVTSAVREPLSVRPNNPLISPYVRTPLPIGLWAYNYLYTDRKTGFRAWLFDKLAKNPVLISDVRPEARLNVVHQILENRGYFGAWSSYEMHRQRNPRKARLSYFVHVPHPSFYSSIEYPAVTNPVTHVIDSLRGSSLLWVGQQYDVSILTAERARIVNNLRDQGFFYFRNSYLEYQADSVQRRDSVALRMIMPPGVPADALKKYRVGKVTMNLANVLPGPLDSIDLRHLTLNYQKPLRVRRRVLARAVTVHPGDMLTVESQNETQNNLSRLGIFRYVNLTTPLLDSIRGRDSIDISIDAAMDAPLEAQFEADVTSKSNGFVGPGVIFGVSNKNFMRGGEVFSVRLNGSYEWQTGSRESNSSVINSYELGITTSLSLPRLLLPRSWIPRNRFPARTTFQFSADLLNRPRFFNMLSISGSMIYDFQTRPYNSHSITVFRLTYNNLLRTTAEFDRTMEESPAVALSFRNQLIPMMSYTYTLNRSYGEPAFRRFFWQATVSQAGNITAGIMGIFGNRVPKYLLGNQFSQFVKAENDLRLFFKVWGENWLATRLLIGAGYAYGNSEVLPFSEQFYIGGASSIRAFTIRSIGPGSFRPASDRQNAYLDQTGDFKLEANVELRLRLFGRLGGAVFVDAGNIWLIRPDPNRPGAALGWRGLADQIALGTGVGLRYDISFLVIRADLGIGIHTPHKNPDRPGYYNMQNFRESLSFHLAIGYPF